MKENAIIIHIILCTLADILITLGDDGSRAESHKTLNAYHYFCVSVITIIELFFRTKTVNQILASHYVLLPRWFLLQCNGCRLSAWVFPYCVLKL